MLKKIDKMLLISVILIAVFGIIMIYSASSIWAEYKYNDPFKFVKAQTAFFIIGLIIMYITTKINITPIPNTKIEDQQEEEIDDNDDEDELLDMEIDEELNEGDDE